MPKPRSSDRAVSIVALLVFLLILLVMCTGCEYVGVGPQPELQRSMRDYAIEHSYPPRTYEVWVRRVN